jgi:hypothetical protein
VPRHRHACPSGRPGLHPGIISPAAGRLASCYRAASPSPGWRSFFKNRLGGFILLRMEWARLQTGQAQLAQPLADRSLAHRDLEPSRHLRTQIDTAPAHDLMRVGTTPMEKAWSRGCAILKAISIAVPTGHSRAFMPTFQSVMAGSGRWRLRRLSPQCQIILAPFRQLLFQVR